MQNQVETRSIQGLDRDIKANAKDYGNCYIVGVYFEMMICCSDRLHLLNSRFAGWLLIVGALLHDKPGLQLECVPASGFFTSSPWVQASMS